MIDKDVDLEGVTFRSPCEQDLFIAGQRERAIAERAKHPVVQKEANDKARELLYKAAKARESARLVLNKSTKLAR